MRDAVSRFVHDGDTVVIEGFTHLICFAAGHEIIRQRRRDLTLARLTPDLIYDQMIAAGCARKLVFSWAGNPGVGSLHAFRRAVEGKHASGGLEIEEYSHFGMVARFSAGAARLPFWPLRNYMGTDLPAANPRIRTVACPYTGESLATVPALNPGVTIVHAQRADAAGNTQMWGLVGVQKEAAFASERVIVVVEELVEEAVIRSDPNRTVIPGMIVSAVVVEPWGAHPSYAQGYYDRDNDFYVAWEGVSREPDKLARYLDEFVYAVGDPALVTGSLMVCGMADVFQLFLQNGRIEVGFLGGAQVDRYGNINTTVIGPYERPTVRLPGSGGAAEIAVHAQRTLIVAKLNPRAFPERVDFVTSPGQRCAGRGRRELGMPGAGPVKVITDKGVLEADPATGEMVLAALYPGVTTDDVQGGVGWPLTRRPRLGAIAPPSATELRLLRHVPDPKGLFLKS